MSDTKELTYGEAKEAKADGCDGCIHKLLYYGRYPFSCLECSRFYSDRKEVADGSRLTETK